MGIKTWAESIQASFKNIDTLTKLEQLSGEAPLSNRLLHDAIDDYKTANELYKERIKELEAQRDDLIDKLAKKATTNFTYNGKDAEHWCGEYERMARDYKYLEKHLRNAMIDLKDVLDEA
jgi:exonuclease VII small subunit